MIYLGKYFSTFYVQFDDTTKVFKGAKILFKDKECIIISIHDKILGLQILTNNQENYIEINE